MLNKKEMELAECQRQLKQLQREYDIVDMNQKEQRELNKQLCQQISYLVLKISKYEQDK